MFFFQKIECYFLIKENRANLTIFGMFYLDPSLLLSVFLLNLFFLLLLLLFFRWVRLLFPI